MAEDPKQTLKELEESFSKLNDLGTEIVKDFGESLNAQLRNSIINSEKLVKEVEKGKDITKGLANQFTNVKNISRSLYQEQLSLEAKLANATKENQKAKITNQLNSIKAQQKLNEYDFEELKILEQINQELKKENILSNALKASSEKILGTSASTLTSMLTMSGIFALIIDGALQFNKASVATGKALGYSSEKANNLQSDFNSIARSTTDVNISSKSLNEAFGQLAQSTGLVYEYSEDTLKTQILLTKVVGLQADEAAQIQRYSALTNTSSSQVYNSFIKGLVAQRNQSRVGINFKETLAESVKISGRLAANLGYNPERIAKAVVQAKAFGMTLEQTSKIGDSLLDFESSIENELKAELLTGRQLNLERARAAALSGDQATLAEEISKNVGTAADFAKMNVLEQKALAEATGMTSDELSETLRKREEALKSGKSLAQVTEDDAKKAIERQDIQTKFNAGIEKLQSLIGGILAGPLGGFLDVLTESLDVITAIAGVFGVIYAIDKSIAAIEALKYGYAVGSRAAELGKNGILIARQAILGGELTKAIGIAAAYAIANPIQAAIGLALAAGVGAMVASQMDDGIIGPGGETVVSGPKGSIQLNKNDSIVAGTDLFGKGKEGETAITPSIDLTPMISAINEVKSAIDRLYSKDTSVSLDGKKVGTTLTQGSYKVA
jgi:hypothetical protein